MLSKYLTGTPTRKRPIGGPRLRWDHSIRMDLKEIGINTRNWVDSKIGIIRDPCEYGIEPPGSISHGVSYYYYILKISLCLAEHNVGSLI